MFVRCCCFLLLLSSCASEAPPPNETEPARVAPPAADPSPCGPDHAALAAAEAGVAVLRAREPASVAVLVVRAEDGCEVATLGDVDAALNPGSVLKPLVMAAALTDGLDPTATHDGMSLTDVIVRSSNDGMGPAYAALGDADLATWSERLGWAGDVRMHRATVPPRDVARGYLALVDPTDATFTADAARRVRAMLEAAVGPDGTGRRASESPVPVAGKTGTSLLATSEPPDDTRVTFVGWAPADEPEFVVFVTAARPDGRAFAGELAAPAFAAIVTELFAP